MLQQGKPRSPEPRDLGNRPVRLWRISFPRTSAIRRQVDQSWNLGCRDGSIGNQPFRATFSIFAICR